MKKLIGFLIAAVFIGCTCLGQLQTQYLYVDENCNAQVPDYMVIANGEDNCDGEVSLSQYPPVNSYITINMEAYVRATDISGNINESTFSIILLDTIPPTLYFTDTIAYNTSQMRDIYTTWLVWSLKGIEEFRENFDYEEFNLDPNDPDMNCFRHVFCIDQLDEWLTSVK